MLLFPQGWASFTQLELANLFNRNYNHPVLASIRLAATIGEAFLSLERVCRVRTL
jgi:hypothetical protein